MNDQPHDELAGHVKALGHALQHQAKQIAEMRQDVKRAIEWMTTLTFDDAGTFAPGEMPPILKLLAAIQDESRTIAAQNARIIEQNALLVGDPTAAEAAAMHDAQAAGGVSLPALLKTMRDVRWDVRLIAAGLVATLILLAGHHWYLVDRFSSALGWLAALLR